MSATDWPAYSNPSDRNSQRPTLAPQKNEFPDVVGIKSYDHQGLLDLMKLWGEQSFRAKQLEQWLYGRCVTSYGDMTDLPATLRTRLNNYLTLPIAEVEERLIAKDGTRKYLIGLADGNSVETVGIPDGARLTVCVSSQVGCAMDCAFCATGRAGLTRSLTAGEIVDQVNIVARDFSERVSNVVVMGQGEPFANYDATLGAVRLLNDPKLLGIGARRITVSTCGLIEKIYQFATEPEQFTLAVSLHSAVQATRDALMPRLARQPLSDLKEALMAYVEQTGRRPTLEFALIAGVNDSTEQFNALVSFCRGIHCHINVLALNPTSACGLRPSPQSNILHFVKALSHYGFETTLRTSRGQSIQGACGQLAGVQKSSII